MDQASFRKELPVSKRVEGQPSASTGRRVWSRWALPLILIGAVALRLPTFYGTLPDLYWHDELNFIEGALRIGAGEIKGASFGGYGHGTLTYFLLFSVFAIWFVLGWLAGTFPDVPAFILLYVTDPTGFVLLTHTVMLVASVATVGLTYVVGKRLFDAKAGLFASFLMATSFQSVHMTYGKEDGIFTFLMLLTFLSMVRTLAEPERPGRYVLTGVLLGAATAVKYFGLVGIALMAALAWLGSGFRWREAFKRFGLSLFGFTGAFLLCMPGIVLDTGRVIGSLLALREGNAGIQMAASSQGGGWYGYLWTTYAASGGVVLTLLFYGGVAVILWERLPKGMFLLIYPVTLTLALTTVLLVGKGIEAPYYQLSTIPFLCIAAGRFLARTVAVPGLVRWSAYALFFAAVFAQVGDVMRFQRLVNTDDSRTVVRKWIEAHVPGDASILVEGAVSTFVLQGPQLKENRAALERDRLANRERGASGRMAEAKLQALQYTDRSTPQYDVHKLSWSLNVSAKDLHKLRPDYVVVRNEAGRRVVESSSDRPYRLVFSILPDSPQLFWFMPLLSVADLQRLRGMSLFDRNASPLVPGPALWVYQALA